MPTPKRPYIIFTGTYEQALTYQIDRDHIISLTQDRPTINRIQKRNPIPEPWPEEP